MATAKNAAGKAVARKAEAVRPTRKVAPAGAPFELFARALAASIESGKYTVGSLLPPEPELCAQYGLSRHSVREGVRKLVQMGLVTRHQGIGTRVVSNEAAPQDLAALTSMKALFSYVLETYLKIDSESWVVADETLAGMLGCKVGQRWLEVNSYRFPRAGKQPLSRTVLYISPAFEGIRPHLAEVNRPVFALIEEHYGQQVHDLQMSVTALSIDAKMAKALGCKPGSPGLRVIRRYRGANDALLSASISIYPPSRFEVSIRYRLDWAGV